MRKMKRFTAAAAAALVLGLAGCSGGNSGTESQSGQTSQQTAGGEESQTAGQTESGMTELTFWHSMDSVYAEVMQAQVDLFNETVGKEKNIHVTSVFQNWP